jgi:hypothetical protein
MLTIVWIGAVVGLIHFFVIGLLYGNPLVAKIYEAAQANDASVRKWTEKKSYLIIQFLGTQVEIYILTVGFFWLRPLIPTEGTVGAVAIGALFAALRVYPRFWNMWIQSTYPALLLKIEFINGVIGTMVVVISLQLFLN